MTDQRTPELDPAPRWSPQAPPRFERPAAWPAPEAWDPARTMPLGPPPASGPHAPAPPPFPPFVPGPASMPSGAGTGGPGATPIAPPPARAPRRRGAGVVLAAAAVFAAGTGGVLVGKGIADDSVRTSVSSPAASSTPVVTVPGPITGNSQEPVAAVAAAVAPAVVQIETQEGLGSGFIYDKSGLILTAGHVVGTAQQVQVRMADGARYEGTVVGSDNATDVAVVKISADAELPVAVLATGVQPQVGQLAVAIGSPFGLDQTVTAGIVSAVGRSTETPGGVIPAIQTDAPINSGNSGGALADRQGRVIGINDSIITGSSQATGNVGVGFAIPISLAKVVADKLVSGTATKAGYLGVRGSDSSGEQAGAMISEVEAGSPAAKAGLAADDVVVGVAGRKVGSMTDLVAVITTTQPGDKVSLTVLRNGQERTLEVTLGSAS